MTGLAAFKLAFAHVETLLDRRLSLTSFHLSVNVAIATIIDLLLKHAQHRQKGLMFSRQ